ncbi:MAG: hypothetical protein HY437_01705 [Candidatus Magasanikbacteria bacterium]|nr:hypothetical protein [Candidatus Magasanikbacteria bacterium]
MIDAATARTRHIVLIAGAIIFFLSTSALYIIREPVFNSPDEAANDAVIERFAREGELWLPAVAADTQEIRNLVHPRSMQVVGDRLVPAGFLGLPVVYGVIAWFTHPRVIAVLTPLFALAGLAALYFLVLKVWNDKRVAALSAALLALHPAFWYYTARGLFHNVLFVSLLFFGACMMAYRNVILEAHAAWADRIHRHKGIVSACIDMVALILIWLALLVRPSEFWWVLALGVALMWWYRSAFSWKRLSFWFFTGGILALVTVLLYRYVYGDVPLFAVAAQYGGGTEGVVNQAWWRWFLPFGFHPRVMLWSAARWYGLLALPFTLLSLGGLVLTIRAQSQNIRRWAWVFLGVTAWLLVVYGSWLIFDNPSHEVTIGGAYLRYWLPSFVLGAPFGAYFIVWCMEKLSNKWRMVIGGVVALVLIAFTFYVAVLRTDGVRDVGQAMDTGAAIRDGLKTHDGGIPANSVILTDREDKFFTGTWQVIQPVKNNDNLRAVYDLLNEGKPVFFVTPARSIDEWRDLKENWFADARIMYTYWFSVGEYEVHALKKVTVE